MLAVHWLDSLLEGLYTVFNLAESSEETSKQEDLVMMWPTSLDVANFTGLAYSKGVADCLKYCMG